MKLLKWLVSPVPVLMLLAPSTGELLSGSAPPTEFFNPVGFIMLMLLYGGGAVLIRELLFRWKAGMLSLLLLGAAYGIIEEGIMVKSFTDPNWGDMTSGLGHYGRWVGVNWVWSVGLTFFHAIISISVPVLLTGLIFPAWRDRAWLSGRKFTTLLGLVILDGLFIFFFISKHIPPLWPYLGFWIVTIGLIVLAWRVAGVSVRADALYQSSTSPAITKVPTWTRRLKIWLVGFFTICMIFFTTFGIRQLGLPPISTIILQFMLIGGGLYGAYCLSLPVGGFGDRLTFAIISGLLWPMILLAITQEFDKTRPDNTTGMAVVGLAFAVILLLLGRKVKKISPVVSPTG